MANLSSEKQSEMLSNVPPQMAFINASRHLVKVQGVSDMTTALNTMKVINMKNLVLMMMMFNSYTRTFTSFNI
jgi:hypothetical protein